MRRIQYETFLGAREIDAINYLGERIQYKHGELCRSGDGAAGGHPVAQANNRYVAERFLFLAVEAAERRVRRFGDGL